MMRRLTNSLALLLLLVTVRGDCAAFSVPQSTTYQSTRQLLSTMDAVKNDSDQLAALFKVGDQRVEDLVRALDDPEREISVRAQIVIRYLGNVRGMAALLQWYEKHPIEQPIAGPIPLPLSAWDYEFINFNLIEKPPETWREIGVRYIYALAMDDSDLSKKTLDRLMKNASAVNPETFVGGAIRQVQRERPTNLMAGEKDLATLVLDNAFFVSAGDRKHSKAQVLALNSNKDKVLVEIHINRGHLAEEWHHVVIKKCGQGWKFFSITQVAVS